MKKIIPPVSKEILESEFAGRTMIRKTNNGNNEIYIFSHHESPVLMEEVGRLREVTFREAGGGTGKVVDIDEFDTDDTPFLQLIVWNPRDKEIVGGYRFIRCDQLKVKEDGRIHTPTAKLFDFSEKFLEEVWPFTIELGRSFVQPMYQPSYNIRKGMYSLDNLWDGLGAIVIDNPDVKYFFGKITMYPHFDLLARDMILYFLHKYFPDRDKLVWPREPLPIKTENEMLENIFTGDEYEENYKILIHKVRGQNENVPPLVNAYMNLSSTMRCFGTALNAGFGNVEETAIIVTLEDIYTTKKDRHLNTYRK